MVSLGYHDSFFNLQQLQNDTDKLCLGLQLQSGSLSTLLFSVNSSLHELPDLRCWI